ncbi:MAG: hypothetical protein NVSMB64_11410 [Candidatus Velthaea sp.]
MSKHLATDDARAVSDGPNWRRIFPYAFLAVMIVFSAVCGLVALRMVQTKESFVNSAVGYFVPAPRSIFGKDRIYIALLGLDYNYDEKDQEYSTNSRTDKISIFGLDFPTHAVKEIAVPRDMAVVLNGHENKINAAYQMGGERRTDQVVGEFLGMPKNERGTYFDRYLILRINATKEFIDAIGGIDVPVEKEMNYDDSWGHLHIHFHPGLQHMNGEQAVSYARFRHDECGDPCRLKRQQKVVKIAVQKLKGDKFNDLTHIASLIGVINRNVVTNLTDDEKRSLAWHFKDLNLSDFKSDQIAYTTDKDTAYGGNVLVADEKQKAQLVAGLTGPYTNETPPPAPGPANVASIAPASVHIAVQNGSGQKGLGGKMADALRKRGFVVDSVANADAFTYDTTVIREHSKLPGVGERVRTDLALKSAAVSPGPAKTAAAAPASPEPTDVTVIVGRDFAAALAAQPAQKGTSPQ